ncbi:MAG TPA: response regulator [Spirochaetia bacterium]|nr:response regulator [Spirochaetia bacterium]
MQPALVLLLDDDADFLELERKIFHSRGYEVSGHHEPQSALAALAASAQQGRRILIVCDLMMKNLDSGFSFARTVKGDPRFRDIPLVIVSAIASQKGFDFHPRTPADLAGMNADAFFDKPVQPQALLAAAEKLLSPGTPA